jgi:hypothetical protein
MSVNKVDTAALKDFIGDFVAALRLATPGKKNVVPWKGRITKATSMQVGLFAKRIATAYPEFTAHFNAAKKAIEIYLPAGVSLSGIAKALAHPKSVTTASADVPSIEDLALHADNTAPLYRLKLSLINTLAKKMLKGVYDHNKSKTLWLGYANHVAQSYTKEFPSTDSPGLQWHEDFPMPLRKKFADILAKEAYPDIVEQSISLRAAKNAKPSYRSKDVNKAALKDLNTHTASHDFTVMAVLNADDATKMLPVKVNVKTGDKLRCLRGEAHTEFRVNNEQPGYLIGNVMFDRVIKPNMQ